MSSGSRQAQNGGSNPTNSPVPRITSFQPADAGARTTDPWQLFEERVRWGPYGLRGFPGQSLSPLLLLDGEISGVNHLPRQFVREFPPRRRGQWNVYPEEEPNLTQEQQRKALKELKKHVYNPARNIPRRWSFYNRENPSNSTHLKEEGRDDDGKGCPICLEDFVPNEEVLMTPCNHMFHDVCIRPWVKSHGKCPVCRFTLCDMGRRASSPNDPIRLRNDIMPGELLSLVRAVEETFEWLTVPR
ncbi:RING-H2 finger protein ATL46-like [Macadamia integrifolia]|uniref:RING-H2 finger protein ATL46-like n=1 Tax=Macadamia integrifolia TaxID=60698 RepID=UPI001C529BDE|nr:RING-H2 finger protein ATL46-like [Macadamia integrifolia]